MHFQEFSSQHVNHKVSYSFFDLIKTTKLTIIFVHFQEFSFQLNLSGHDKLQKVSKIYVFAKSYLVAVFIIKLIFKYFPPKKAALFVVGKCIKLEK